MSDSGHSKPTRRGFFGSALRELVRSVLPADEQDDEASDAPPVERKRIVLRPPGARAEDEFVDICDRSGACVSACPASAIRVIDSRDERIGGTPEIIPGIQACVICESLACMNACPSGALQLVPAAEIRIGLAVVRHELCLRSQGEECRLCVDHCPIGLEAIGIDREGRIDVQPAACTGCGVCEMYCPTSPRAITIRPLPGD